MLRLRSLAAALLAAAACSLSTPISHAASTVLTYGLHWEANHTVALITNNGTVLRTLSRGHQLTLRNGKDTLTVSLKGSTSLSTGTASATSRSASRAGWARSTSSAASAAPAAIAEEVLGAINASRFAHRVPLLTLSVQQSTCSAVHSAHMARMGAISHDQFPADVCTQHIVTGENVGEASGDPATASLGLHHSMMSEGPCPHLGCPAAEFEEHGHYMNLINPAYRHVGIGIVVQSGVTWLTEDFTD